MAASAAARAALASPWYASACASTEEHGDPQHRVVIGLGLGNQSAHWAIRSGQIAPYSCAPASRHAALPRSEAVTDRVGKVASFFGGRAHRDRVAGDERRLSLLAEDLVQPPLVSDCPRQADRLGEVAPGHLGVVDAALPQAVSARASSAGSSSSRAIVESLFRVLQAVRWTTQRVEHGLVGERPRAHRGRHLDSSCVLVAEDGVEPGQPFLDAARGSATAAAVTTPAPARARCRRVSAAPPECASEIVDLDSLPVRLAGHSHCVPARRARPPSTCSGRGDVTAPPRPRRTRRASPARIGARSRAAGIAFGHWCFRRPPTTCRRAGRADREPGSAPPRHRRRPLGRRRDRTRRGTPPAGGTERVRSRSATRATSPPTRAGSAVGAPRCARHRSTGGSGRADCRRSRPATVHARAPQPVRWPAACRRVGGRSPSRWRRSSSVTLKSGRTRRARSANSSMASSASDSDGTARSPRLARRSARGWSRAASTSGRQPRAPPPAMRLRRADARSCPTPSASGGRRRTAQAFPSSNGRV